MRKLSSLVTCAALTLTAGLIGCVDASDPLDSFTTATVTATNTAADQGDGDGDTTGGDGDGDQGDGDGDGDGDTGCPVGTFGCPCDNGTCVDTLVCGPDDTCGLGGGDGDGDGDTGPANCEYDPNMCEAPCMVLGVEGLEGNFCSAPCTANPDCPAGPPNTTPACALVTPPAMDPTNCALICTPGSMDCPAGSTCKDVPEQMGVGICTYP